MNRNWIAVALATVGLTLLGARDARAGGFELPDNGAEALGRGGAFVAKADDGLALEYNIAGFARQRGTRLTLSANLLFHDLAFTRDGVYPGDPTDARTPEAGKPYPTVHDGSSLFLAPSFAVSTDLGGLLKRWTLAAGLWAPSSVGTHDYNVGDDVGGNSPPARVKLSDGTTAPGPARYDLSKTNLIIAFPTLAAAFHPWKYLDVGLAWQIVYASFDIANANLTPLGARNCPTPEYAGCDAYGRVRSSGTSFSSSDDKFKSTQGEFGPGFTSFGWLFSLLGHPTTWMDLGFTLRPEIKIDTQGKLHVTPPPAMPSKFADMDATFQATLPTWIRAGGRVVSRYLDGTERADLELDLVWENWSVEKGDHLNAQDFPLASSSQLDAEVVHRYQDTFGVRVGGAWNFRLAETMRATARAGFFFDSAATASKDTRLDFNTLDKFGFTLGGGFRMKGFTLNLAYAYVYSPTRTVHDSEILALSSVSGSSYGPSDAQIAVTNGRYEPSIHILSVGVTVNFSEFKLHSLMPN